MRPECQGHSSRIRISGHPAAPDKPSLSLLLSHTVAQNVHL